MDDKDELVPDVKHSIIVLQSRLYHITAENERMDSMLTAACDQITDLLKRLRLAEEKIEIMAEKVFLTFYGAFPGMGAADDALAKAVKEAGKEPKGKP